MYILGLTSIAAILLTVLFVSLKPIHEKNEALFKQKEVLEAISGEMGWKVNKMSADEVTNIFNKQIKQYVLDHEGNEIPDVKAEMVDLAKEDKKSDEERQYPMFVYSGDKGNYYIMPVRGNGLWDKIWGYIAIQGDFSTVAGVSFGHKAETPGLGAEIKDNANFKKQFNGRKIYNEQGDFVSVNVRKGGAKDKRYEVNSISGATVTCDGVTEMLKRGIAYYEPYFAKQKK